MRIGIVAAAIVAMQAPQVEAVDTLSIGLKILEGARGGWLGFNRGLYKRASSMPLDA